MAVISGLHALDSQRCCHGLQLVGRVVAGSDARTPAAECIARRGMVEQHEIRVRPPATRRPHTDDLPQAIRLFEHVRGLAAHTALRKPYTDALPEPGAP